MFLNFGNLKNESTGDRYWGKTIEKTMLRVLRSRTFSHSLGRVWTFLRKPSNRQLSWFGCAVGLAGLIWAVVTYVWPAPRGPTAVCADQGIAIGGKVSG